ncbi:MAG: hypothetical protein HPY66_2384 [Firmicutes bacterium]|nr:hypothetical protein [Bacillota bacterium]MDI6706597.1 hypothetical protein [Bacillota bacterium]
MMERRSPWQKKYIKISQKSGCISANYNIIEKDEDSIIVSYENDESSGEFRYPNH